MSNPSVRTGRIGFVPVANTQTQWSHVIRACSIGAVLAFGLAGPSWGAVAGTQSLVLAPGTRAVAVDPTQAATQSWRVEFQMHAWSPQTATTTTASLWTMHGTGATAGVSSNTGAGAQGETLRLTDERDLAVSPCSFSLVNRSNVLVRVQRDAVNGRFVCEIWNGDGSGYDHASSNFAPSSVWTGTGGDFGSSTTTAKIGFFRTFATILADGASAPALVTLEPTYTQLEFEGSTVDSSGNHHDATLSGATYATTPLAAQSLSLTPGAVSTKVGEALYGISQSLRFEFQMHGWSATTGTGTIWSLSSIGATAAIYQATNGVSWLRLVDARDTATAGTGVCDLSLASRTNVMVRVQRDATQNRFVCEIWNADGTGYAKSSYGIVPVSKTFSGKGFGGASTTVKLAFARLFNTILADGSAMPAPFVKDSALNYWDFDGNVADSSGGHHDITMASPAYAQTLIVAQSLTLVSGNPAFLVSDPARAATSSWRVEFQLNNWCPTTGGDTLWHMGGLGVWASTYVAEGGTVILRTYDERDTMVTGASVNDVALNGRTNVLVRIQRDAAKSRFVTELWNLDGTGYESFASTFSPNAWSGSGGSIGGGNTSATLGFFRILDTVVPDGSTPPTTYSSEVMATNLRFDGTLLDASGNHHDASGTGAVFGPTPKQPPVSLPRTGGAPTWSTWVSLRAGFAATLDGSHSFSMDGTSNVVTYAWTATGPTPVVFSDPTAANPTVRGLVFGTYTFTLAVTDVTGQSTTSVISVGAVATDNNGVVVQANPAADLIFGPMIAFGKNPWPWADQMALHSAQVRQPYLAAISPPGWGANLSGTISYIPSSANSSSQTTLASAIGPTDTTITVTDVSTMDLSVLPALIMIHTPSVWTPVEQIRICGVAGNVLTVCYDGRAFMAGTYEQVSVAQSWPALSIVRQATTKGVGTKFLTDFCAAGPGEPGFVAYKAGTVSPTPGSTMLTGTGTAWNGTYESLRIRIQGTHRGVAFVFFSSVANVASGNSMMLGRPWPVDADAGSFSYAILQPSRYMVRGWLRPDLTVGNSLSSISSCESDTRVYHGDIFSSVQGNQTGQTVRFQDASQDWFSEFGPNYYDEVLAHYAGYYRSGFSMFRDNARAVGDYLPTAPGFDQGWQGILPRRVGATGLVAAAVLDGTDDTGAANTRVNNWYTIRRLASQAIENPYAGGAILAPCTSDVREGAYGLSWIALAAMFDPVDTGDPNTPNQRSYWKAQLALALARDKSCKGANNEFPAPSFNTGASFTLTNGSTTVTGSNVSPSMCPVTGTGTIACHQRIDVRHGHRRRAFRSVDQDRRHGEAERATVPLLLLLHGELLVGYRDEHTLRRRHRNLPLPVGGRQLLAGVRRNLHGRREHEHALCVPIRRRFHNQVGPALDGRDGCLHVVPVLRTRLRPAAFHAGDQDLRDEACLLGRNGHHGQGLCDLGDGGGQLADEHGLRSSHRRLELRTGMGRVRAQDQSPDELHLCDRPGFAGQRPDAERRGAECDAGSL